MRRETQSAAKAAFASLRTWEGGGKRKGSSNGRMKEKRRAYVDDFDAALLRADQDGRDVATTKGEHVPDGKVNTIAIHQREADLKTRKREKEKR